MIRFLSTLLVRVYPSRDPVESLGHWTSSPPWRPPNDNCPQAHGVTNSELHSLCSSSSSVCNWQILTLRGKCTSRWTPLPGLFAMLSKDTYLYWVCLFIVVLGSRVSSRQSGSLLQEIKLSPDFFLVISFEPEMAEAVPSDETSLKTSCSRG